MHTVRPELVEGYMSWFDRLTTNGFTNTHELHTCPSFTAMRYSYIIRRLLSAVPVLLIITFATFALMQALPGGPLAVYENNPEIKQEDIERLRHELGLDRPLHIQYIRWLQNFVRGDWGYSFATKRPVLTEIWERLPNTIYLTGLSLIGALLIAIPVGIISATKQYSFFDHVVTTATYIGRSMPVYYSGLLLIIFFSIWLRWLPAGGMYTLGKEFSLIDSLKHLFLPLLSLSTLIAAKYVRFLRTSMLEVIHQDYIRTAEAKGLHEKVVIYKHAFRNAAIPLVTIVAIDLPVLFAGALFTETIYSWPGMGRLFVNSSFRFDYPIVMGIVITLAFLVVISNLLADIVYAILDPRITYT